MRPIAALLLTVSVTLFVTTDPLRAAPAEARQQAAAFIQAVSTGDCRAAAQQVAWPLRHADETVGDADWTTTCRALRKPLSSGRIARVFAIEALTALQPEPMPRFDDPWFVDVVSGGDSAAPASGLSLVFDCSGDTCLLRAVYPRLLHHTHYAPQPASPEVETAVRAGRLANVLAQLTPLKIMLVEHYQVTGEWPQTLEAIGVDRDAMHSGMIDRVEITGNGHIRAWLNQTFGAGRILELVPKMEMDRLSVAWNCRSNLAGELLAHLRGLNCRPLRDTGGG